MAARIRISQEGIRKIELMSADMLRETCKELRDTARRHAAKGDTGALAKSITYRTSGVRGRVTVTEYYWPFVEYGHQIYVPGRKGEKATPTDRHTSPNPFMRRALTEMQVS